MSVFVFALLLSSAFVSAQMTCVFLHGTGEKPGAPTSSYKHVCFVSDAFFLTYLLYLRNLLDFSTGVMCMWSSPHIAASLSSIMTVFFYFLLFRSLMWVNSDTIQQTWDNPRLWSNYCSYITGSSVKGAIAENTVPFFSLPVIHLKNVAEGNLHSFDGKSHFGCRHRVRLLRH